MDIELYIENDTLAAPKFVHFHRGVTDSVYIRPPQNCVEEKS